MVQGGIVVMQCADNIVEEVLEKLAAPTTVLTWGCHSCNLVEMKRCKLSMLTI